jgi:hypothetical protein
MLDVDSWNAISSDEKISPGDYALFIPFNFGFEKHSSYYSQLLSLNLISIQEPVPRNAETI